MDESIKSPPGYRFTPIDQELISFYLKPKVLGQKLPCNVVEEKQLYGPNANPWQVFDENHEWILSEVSPGKFEKVTYVYVNLTKKGTVERKTKGVREQYIKKAGCGTWDGQTKRSDIRDCNGNLIGEKRLLVFEINEVCGMDLSKVGYWKMHEYHLFGVNEGIANSSNTVLCKITSDHSKNPPIKSRPNSNHDYPKKSSSKPRKKNTNVDSGNGDGNQGVSESHGGAAVTTQTRRDDLTVLDSDETCDGVEGMNSNYDEESILRTASSASEVVDTCNMKPVSSGYHDYPIKSSSKPWKKNTNGDSGTVDGNQRVSESHGGAVTTQTRHVDLIVLDSDETCDGVEGMKSNYDEESILRTASSPSEVVDTGNMKPVSSNYRQPAKYDNDYQNFKKEFGEGDSLFGTTKVQFSGNPKAKEDPSVKDNTTNRGKRKLEVETSYTITKKMSLIIN